MPSALRFIRIAHVRKHHLDTSGGKCIFLIAYKERESLRLAAQIDAALA